MSYCDTCEHIGIELEHLRGFDGVEKWYHCKVPIPVWVVPRAVNKDQAELYCDTYSKKED